MSEDAAKSWVGERYGMGAVERLTAFASRIIEENDRQNLISPSTVPAIWCRHLLDSAQLVPLAPARGVWLDIGSGAGLPGMVAAILRPEPTVLVEPRRQRADHLRRCAELLDLHHVEVREERVEATQLTATVISARAVAPVEKLLQAAMGCGTKATRWLLPRGTFGADDLTALRRNWRGVFHMKQSLTSAASTILICDGPSPR